MNGRFVTACTQVVLMMMSYLLLSALTVKAISLLPPSLRQGLRHGLAFHDMRKDDSFSMGNQTPIVLPNLILLIFPDSRKYVLAAANTTLWQGISATNIKYQFYYNHISYMVNTCVKVDENFASLQHQMASTNSGAGKGPSAINVSDDETSPKSYVTFRQLYWQTGCSGATVGPMLSWWRLVSK